MRGIMIVLLTGLLTVPTDAAAQSAAEARVRAERALRAQVVAAEEAELRHRAVVELAAVRHHSALGLPVAEAQQRVERALVAERAVRAEEAVRREAELALVAATRVPVRDFQALLERLAVPAPEAWAPQDPADSLWRAARAALNDGAYRRAGDLFGQIIARHPRSEYAGAAHYYQALALSRMSDRESLQRARETLERMAQRQDRTTQQIRDAEALRVQIDAQLQRMGDVAATTRNTERAAELRAAEAAERARTLEARARTAETRARQERDCEDDEVRMIALQAVMRSNPDAALPILREVLARTDACAQDLKHMAFMLLGQSSNPEARRVLVEAARSASDPEAQAAALMFLSESDDPAFLDMALEVLRTATDEDVQHAALMSLQRSRSPRAREALREFIRRPGTDDEARAAAIMFLGSNAGEEDVRFLRQLYPSVQEEELKQAILMILMQRGASQDVGWLMEIATNSAEDEDVRQMALMTAGQSPSVTAAQLARIYDTAGDEDMRQHVVILLSQRLDEPAAVDKLLAVARDTTTNADVRRHVILTLSQSDDPRVQQALLEIIRR